MLKIIRSMNKILLANIGNRNISYIGQNDKVNLSGAHFRNSTRYLFENFEKEKVYIKLCILPPLLDMLRPELETVYLFGTNSPEGEWNLQDTLYEAFLLKALIEEQYEGITVHVIEVPCRVVDINELMRFYRNELSRIQSAHANEQFVLCDAGGTSQQKSSLKIVAEYLISNHRLEMYNINFVHGKSIPEKIASVEYRKVIDQEQMAALIERYNYSGAKTIYTSNKKNQADAVTSYLSIAAELFSNEVNKAIGLARNPPKNLAKNDVLKSLVETDYFKGAIKKWEYLFDAAIIFRLCLILDIAASYQKLKSWGFTTLYYHIFLERFLLEIIATEAGTTDLTKNWTTIKNDIQKGTLFPGITQLAGRPLQEVYAPTVPAQIDLALSLKDQNILKVITKLRSEHQNQFSGNRNKFAHEGRSLNQEDVKFLLPVFETWRKEFDLSSDTIFDQINLDLTKLLKN